MDWIRGDYYMQNKYIEKLINYKSLDEFVTMFFGLSLCEKLSVLGDDMIVPKGCKSDSEDNYRRDSKLSFRISKNK